MNLAAPYDALLARTDGKVLRILAGTTRGLSGRDVARLSGASHNSAWTALRRLVDHGLVNAEHAGGRTVLYTLNRDHLAAEPAIALLDMRTRLIERLRDAVGAWAIAPAHASLFGSAARGDGATSSDIDLLVVRAAGVDEADAQWRAQVDDLADAVLRWTGNHAGIAELGADDVAHASADIRRSVENEGVLLAGTAFHDLR